VGWGPTVGCLVVLVVVVGAVVGGIVWFVGSMYEPRRQVAAMISDYTDLCGGWPIPGAAAYVPGVGPHPVAVFANDQDDEGGGAGIQVTFDADSDRSLFNPTDPAGVQLVACTDRVEDGPRASGCDYQGTAAPLHLATLEITVYEARTGEQVSEPIRVTGDDLDCPTFVWYRGSSPTVYSKPSPAQYQAALASLVTG
jgi:hypothetical protein